MISPHQAFKQGEFGAKHARRRSNEGSPVLAVLVWLVRDIMSSISAEEYVVIQNLKSKVDMDSDTVLADRKED